MIGAVEKARRAEDDLMRAEEGTSGDGNDDVMVRRESSMATAAEAN